ncbi:PREDICTED: cap-specific mRNA (nucleoside-2'-O-)-methyltransferase 2 [Papilio xuthus]|uniref:Cap-specific mRNA (nucleoside-2'-O-)-methyltransferase 2 n=1 Tax=Papilio xuthus TaxID=66420 RepID=A0AAJ6Z8A9_PAPXU|nr:PREDICTED: cap-specific mRNA (nucleoside-2'-O-)-methyltransferase 2 [Papilio xuthus]
MYPSMENFLMQSRQKLYRGEEFEDELNDLFNKKFKFRYNSEWTLPPGDTWFTDAPWKVKGLEYLKSRLNFHKSQLNDFSIEEWSSHTRRRNPAGEVCWKLRCLVNPEFLTQAWTKFYECASTYNIVPPEAISDMKMVSLHLCEAPGAFITSLNHYLKLHHQAIDWKWVANTLNPYYEGNSSSNMISDDRFMFHTLDNWDFGVDNTGNLMDWENSQAIVKKAKSLGKVLLVTADGSIDCLQKPDAQEEVTSPLHYCEIITALQALSPGGTLIFKLFTIFEHSTVNLLYLLNQLFKEVNIYKPITSRQGNSEVYAICLQYKGIDLKPYISTLQSAFGTELYSNKSLFSLDKIPESFLKQIEECAYYFCSIQCHVINNNLQAYLMQKNIALHRDMKKIRAIVASEFIWKYNLKPISNNQELLKGTLHEENKINTNPRYHRGSYTERQLYTKMSLKEKHKNLNTFLQAEMLSNPMIHITEPVKWMIGEGSSKIDIIFTYGKPLQKVNSSKFIFVPIYKLYQQILAEEEFKEIILYRPAKPKIDPSLLGPEPSKIVSLPEFQYRESYNVYEKNCFKTFLNGMRELLEGESILLQNFNTLTHFNVSILYILSKACFEKTGLTSCGNIILSKLINKNCLKYMELIDDECNNVRKDEKKDVLNCLPVQVTNSEDFFSNIVFYNNTFYRNKCIEYLEKIKQSL